MPPNKEHSLVTRILFGTPGDWASRNPHLILTIAGGVVTGSVSLLNLLTGAM